MITRRSLAQMLAVAAVVPQAASSQAPVADADMQAARELLQKNKELIEKVKLPMATEPACHFKA